MNKKNDSFEDNLDRLENIVESLESGINIDEAIKLYEEGIKLSTKLDKRLSNIERKVYEVKNIEALDKGKDDTPKLELFG